MSDNLIGCDIGTSSAKTTVVGLDGKIIGSGNISYEIQIPGPNLAEQDADLLLKASIESIKVAIENSQVDPSDVLGISFSGQAPGCIPVDKEINPIRPMHTYFDNRGKREADWLINILGEEEVFLKTGNFIDPYYGSVKILWELRNEPDVYKRTYKFLCIKDYVIAKLTGWIGTDFSNAALIGIFFNIHTREWIPEITEEIGLSVSHMPVPVPCAEVIGVISKEAADLTGLLEGTPVVAGTVDSCASMLSAGVVHPGHSAISIGTSADWGVECIGNQFVPRTIALPSAASSMEQHLIITTIHSSGGFLGWFRDMISTNSEKVDYSVLESEARKSPIGANGILAIPHLAGKATPVWRPIQHCGFIGLSLANKRGDFVRSIMESIAFALRENRDWLTSYSVSTGRRVGLIGGGFKSHLWAQIVCDVLGLEGNVGTLAGDPAVGDAILAGVGVGALPGTEVAKNWLVNKPSKIFKPINGNQTKYDHLYGLFKQFEEATLNLSSELASFN